MKDWMKDWTRFYDAAGEDPRATLVAALDRFDAEETTGLAVDLGCGTGRDTLELLRRGWRVVAVDGEPEAFARLRAKVDDETAERLETVVAWFEDAVLPRAELVNSSFSLPFCRPDAFDDLWARIVESLPAGGRFAGQLFGVRDQWADEVELVFLTRERVEALLAPFDPEVLDEVETDGETAFRERKHWHVFHIVARKR